MQPTITCKAFRPAVCSDRPTTLQLWVRLEPPQGGVEEEASPQSWFVHRPLGVYGG